MNVLHYSQNKTKYLIKLLLLVKIYKEKMKEYLIRPERVQIQMDSVHRWTQINVRIKKINNWIWKLCILLSILLLNTPNNFFCINILQQRVSMSKNIKSQRIKFVRKLNVILINNLIKLCHSKLVDLLPILCNCLTRVLSLVLGLDMCCVCIA